MCEFAVATQDELRLLGFDVFLHVVGSSLVGGAKAFGLYPTARAATKQQRHFMHVCCQQNLCYR